MDSYLVMGKSHILTTCNKGWSTTTYGKDGNERAIELVQPHSCCKEVGHNGNCVCKCGACYGVTLEPTR